MVGNDEQEGLYMVNENEAAKENGWVYNLGRSIFDEAASLLPGFVVYETAVGRSVVVRSVVGHLGIGLVGAGQLEESDAGDQQGKGALT